MLLKTISRRSTHAVCTSRSMDRCANRTSWEL